MTLFRASLLSLVLATAGCEQDAVEKAEPRLRPVVTMTVNLSDQQAYHEFSGVAKAGLTSRLSFRISGKVEAMAVSVGDKLAPGQLIATLNTSDYLLEKQKSEAALIQAQAESRNATANYRRIKSLYETETASRTELDNAQASSDAARAFVVQAENQLELAKQKMDYTRLVNQQEDCVVASSDTETGENISAGSTVVTIHCGNAAKVETAISESYISQVKRGGKAIVQFNALQHKRFPGIVAEVGVDAKGTAYPVTVALEEGHSDVLPGMAAIVFFIDPQEAGAAQNIYLPLHVVQADKDKTFVYVVNDHGDGSASLVKTPITVGEFNGQALRVVSGLAAGQVIVTKGIRQLYDGMKVKFSRQAS